MGTRGTKHHSLKQIGKILQAADARINAGDTVAQVCTVYKISPATYYLWNKNYGGMTTDQLEQLEKLNETVKALGQQVRQLASDNMILWEALRIAGSLTKTNKRSVVRLIRKKLNLSERRIYAALAESRRRQWDETCP